MMSNLGIVVVVLLLVFVVPLWIVFHYVTRWRTSRGLSADDERMLAQLWENAGRMEERIKTLERVLDVDAPRLAQ